MTEKIDVKAMLDRLERGERMEAPPSACGAPLMPTLVADMVAGTTYCDRLRHYVVDVHRGDAWAHERCPELRRREVRARVAAEGQRLAGALDAVSAYGEIGFDNFDVKHHPSARAALEAMRSFADGLPPRRGVLLAGKTGLGKTRLLLASHFALLEAGVPSEYIRSRELRRLFQQASSFDEEVAHEARLALDLLARCDAVHLDELGDVQEDERRRGVFAEGLKDLLDRRSGAWAVATNLTYDEAETHPDVGTKILSRLLGGGTAVVRCEGRDYRIAAGQRGR